MCELQRDVSRPISFEMKMNVENRDITECPWRCHLINEASSTTLILLSCVKTMEDHQEIQLDLVIHAVPF